MGVPAATVTVTNVIQGPGGLYVAALGAVEPLDGAVNIAPASSAWTDMGATSGGISIEIATEFKPLAVDQLIDDIGSRPVKRTIMAKTSLAEPTYANLQAILNDVTAATGSGYQYIDPVYSTSAMYPTYRAFIVDGVAPGTNKRRRVILRKCLSVDPIGQAFKKDDMTLIPVGIKAHYVSSSSAPYHIVDET